MSSLSISERKAAGKVLRAVRMDAGIPMDGVSGFAANVVSQYEVGYRKTIPVSVLLKYASACAVSPGELINQMATIISV